MRSVRFDLTTAPKQISFPNRTNRILMIHNKSVADKILLQFGNESGDARDAWEILAGDVYTLDPTAPVEGIWLWASVANIDNRVVLG